MTEALPDPMVPADVDLRDFGFMPLHVGNLRDSELVDLSTGAEFKAAVLLWCYAWHQQPAGSLPNDDRILAARSGAGVVWRKVRSMALRGFVECSDGRLYHPLIAEAALDAWERRGAFQTAQETKETRQQRWRAELARLSGLLRDAGVTPPQRPTKAQLRDLCARHGVDAGVDAGIVDVDVSRETQRDVGEVAKTGTGTGTGTNNTPRPPKPAPPASPPLGAGFEEIDEQPEGNGHGPTPAGAVCKALRKAGITSTNPGHPTLLALLEVGATESELVGLAAKAKGKGDPFAWLLDVAVKTRQRAAEIAPTLATGSLPMAEQPSRVPNAEETAARLKAEREHDERAMSPEAHAARRRAMEQVHGVAAALTRTKR